MFTHDSHAEHFFFREEMYHTLVRWKTDRKHSGSDPPFQECECRHRAMRCFFCTIMEREKQIGYGEVMRKYAWLKEPYQTAEITVWKIMLCKADQGFYLFQYSSPDAVQCAADRFYESLEELYEDWNSLIDERGWIDLEDPLPFCQDDAFIPLRVKGRDTGNPEWGRFETLTGGEWVDYNNK